MPKNKKRKHKRRGVDEQLEIIDKLDAGTSRNVMCRDYGIPPSTLSDIKRDREKIKQLAAERGESSSGTRWKDEVDNAIFDWLKRQTSKKVPVLGIELIKEANNIVDANGAAISYKFNNNWMQKFCRKFNVEFCKTSPFIKETNASTVNQFRDKLLETMKKLAVSEKDVYVAKGFALMWRQLSSSVCGLKDFNSLDKFKRDTFATLLCVNADGSHKLNPLMVGKFRNSANQSGKSRTNGPERVTSTGEHGWVTEDVYRDWFNNSFVTSVAEFQNVGLDDVKAILVVDDCPSDLDLKYVSNSSIICLKLPSAASSALPLSRGIFENCKRAYKLKLLGDIFPDGANYEKMEEVVKENLNKYTIETASLNWSSSWEEVDLGYIRNAWSQLLGREESEINQRELCATDFQHALREKVSVEIPEEGILEWLNSEGETPLYQYLRIRNPPQRKIDSYLQFRGGPSSH